MKEGKSIFDTPLLEDGVFKAFTLTLLRYIADDTSIIMDLAKKGTLSEADWMTIYERLQNPDELEWYRQNVEEEILNADTVKTEAIFTKWAHYGWIVDHDVMFMNDWEYCPNSQKDADYYVLKHFKMKKLQKMCDNIESRYGSNVVFHEACVCFNSKCYTACASLLVSLIDGLLIKHKENADRGNLKTGAIAGNRVIQYVSETEHYSLPGIFRFELFGFKVFIDLLFEKANNFKNEPNRVNRNFLHHGMSKRKVLRKDCIKLFVAYKKALDYLK